MAEEASAKLRAKQKPLKDRYRSDPASALVTLTSTGSLDSNSGLSCSIATGAQAKKIAGLHPAAGGAGFDASGELCSGDMLLESLVACFGVTVRAVATSMGIPLEGGSITCQGDLDFRGTLGIKGEDGQPVPVGFTNITLIVRLEVGEEHKASAEKLISLSERYCVVLQTLKQGVSVETKLGHVGRAHPNVRKDKSVNDKVDEQGEGVQQRLDNDEVIRLQ